MNNIKAVLTAGLLVGCSFGAFVPEALAAQTCTVNEKLEMECVEDESSQDSTPKRSNGEEVPLGSLHLSFGSVNAPNFGVPNIELALICPAGTKAATDEKGNEYCQSLDIGG